MANTSMNFDAPAELINRNNGQNQNGDKAALPKSEIWLNPVIEIVTQDEQGKEVTEYVPLPYGLAVDTMNRMKGNSEFARKSNAFLEKAQRDFSTLQPGQSAIIRSGIVLQVRRVDMTKGQVTQSEQEAVDKVEILFT